MLTALCPAGIIAVAIFVVVAGLAVAARFLYRRKETFQNQEVKAEDSPDSQRASEENRKEYFI